MKLKGKNKIFTIFSIVFAAIVSISLYFAFIGNMTDVLVVNQTVRGGTQITESMLSVKKVDKSSLPDNYLKASLRDEVVGKYFDLGLTSGGVLTKDNISVSGKASLIQSGYILYSMKDLETYPNGLVTGDHLNIVVASSSDGNKYVKTIENVPVASVHMEENVITGIEVYVTPEAAQLIAFAQANGDVSVGLLPLDYKNTNIEILDGGGFISSQSETGLLPDFIWAEKSGARLVDANTIESQYDGAYSYNACRLPYHLSQSQDERSQKVVQKMMNFFMKERRVYAGYDMNGTALNQYQAGSFLAPITYASDKGEGYLKLLQQNKYIFTQDLPLDNYYDATMITMIALEMF